MTDQNIADRPLLDVQGLTLRIQAERGEMHAMEDVSFQARAGQVVAIVGESGAGKSVTALSILRLMPMPPARIVAGSVVLDGKDLLKLTKREMQAVRGNVASMIFQEPMTALNPALRVWRQIAEPLVRHRGMSWKQARQRAIELLAEVQIPDPELRAQAYPHQFSGGMRQRVMIAMALACNPKLIVADEPTTALDVTVQAQILTLLITLMRKSGGALLLITHDLGLVARYADHVNVMYAGRIVESGLTTEIYKNPRHHYTRGLLSSVPKLTGEITARLDAIPGQPPTLLGETAGCAFAPRCAGVTPRCYEERPPLGFVSTAHLRACWNL
jgi:oligopeptide transport system ATP-binding protein